MRLSGLTKFRIGNSGAGSGNATAPDIVKDKTASVDAGDVVGTLEPSAGDVRDGATVAGVAGTFSDTAIGATASQVQKDKEVFVNGAKVTGTLEPSAGDIKKDAVIAAVTGTFEGNATGCTASDTLQSSADTERSNAVYTYTKKKETTVKLAGTIRVNFDMKIGSAGEFATGRVYKNGSAIGTERYQYSASYATFSEDFSVVAGDKIQLYILAGSGGTPAYCKNFRLCFTNTYTSFGTPTVDVD